MTIKAGSRCGLYFRNVSPWFFATVLILSGATAGRGQSCISSKSSTWANAAFSPSQSGSFRVAYDATPSATVMDAVGGLSSGSASTVTSLATSVRFSSSGVIDMRNGSSFTAATRVGYTAGKVHHIIMDVNTAAHTYSAYVVINSVQTTLGINIPFRSEQASVKSLSNVGVLAAVGTLSICNITLSGSSSSPSVTLKPSATSLNFGSVPVASSSDQNITLTNTGTANVTISKVSVSGAGYTASGGAAGLILSPNQSATVRATFAPSSMGTLTGAVSVTSNATNSPANVSLTGVGVTATAHSVKLTWSAGTGVSGYNVYSGPVSGGPYTKMNSSLLTGTTYTQTSVQSGHTYYYVVTAVSSSGKESNYSTQVKATVP